MRRFVPAFAVVVLSSCGPATGSPDGSTSSACSIVPTGVSISGENFTFTGDNLSCTGDVNSEPENCGTGANGAATVTHEACADGHAFTVTAGTATLYIRLQQSQMDSTWTAGAAFAGAPALAGSLSVVGLEAPTDATPPAGTVEGVSFVLNVGAPMNGQGVVANGALQVTW